MGTGLFLGQHRKTERDIQPWRKRPTCSRVRRARKRFLAAAEFDATAEHIRIVVRGGEERVELKRVSALQACT